MQIKTTAEAIAWLKTVRHFNCGSVITLLEDAEKREAALREELEAESKGADRAAECLMEWRRDCIDLQQRLTVAEKLLREVSDSPAWGLGDIRDKIDAALKTVTRQQGEPVAICRLWNEGGSGERTSVEFVGEPCADGTLLYAEQPPVITKEVKDD